LDIKPEEREDSEILFYTHTHTHTRRKGRDIEPEVKKTVKDKELL